LAGSGSAGSGERMDGGVDGRLRVGGSAREEPRCIACAMCA